MAGRLTAVADDLTARRRSKTPPKTEPGTPTGDTAVSPEPTGVPDRVAVADIARHPLNPRGVVEEGVDELAASITEVGVLQPLVVASRAVFAAQRPTLVDQLADGAQWVLIAGERRLRAAQVAGLTTVPVVSGDHLVAEGIDIEAMVVENVQRESLSTLQEARAYQLLIDTKVSQRTIAKRVGRTQAHVSRRLSLLRLPAEALLDIEAGDLPIKDAEKLAGIPEDYLPDVWNEAQQWGVGYAINRYNSQREREAQRIKTEKESRRAAERQGLALVTDNDIPAGAHLGDFELDDDDEVIGAREAGTLSGYVEPTSGELLYLDLTREPEPASARDAHRDYEAERRAKEKARRDAGKARRVFAPALITRKLKASELADELATLVIRLANYETIRLAAKFADYHGDGYTWVSELLAGTPAQRERGARAISVAHADLLVHSEWGGWGEEHSAYLAQLAELGYEQTDYDRAKLAEADEKGQAR